MDIDILIGQDLFWTLMSGNVHRTEDSGVVAQQSIFGWVLSGAENKESKFVGIDSTAALLNLNDIPDHVVKSFWDLESIGVGERESVVDPVLERFEQNIGYNMKTGRYKVNLAWKENPPVLANTFRLAKSRLLGLEKRLERKAELKAGYDGALQEMVINGHVVDVDPNSKPEGPVCYLPHHPQVREGRTTTKIRPVFDASGRGSNGISLNDCLDSGPNLNPTAMELLIRFRRWRYALSADIQKAFLQVELDGRDQDVHRFLWRVNDCVRIMKFVRVTFGIKCSPFLLAATIRHHLSLCQPSVVITELTDNMYVDDFLSGADTEAGAHELSIEAKKVMKSAGMILAIWTCNEATVIEDKAGETGLSIKSELSQEYTKVLGVNWIPQEDRLKYEGVDLPKFFVCTKRLVLSLIARVFDPLGLVLPFTVIAKFLFQDIWRLGIEWDEELPPEFQAIFGRWLAGVKELKKISIPRPYFSMSWSECVATLELHAYGDASLKGYGACVYLKNCVSDGQHESVLVKACARVAPLERKTLPRLELLGCLITAQLLRKVMETLRLPQGTKYTCWTDSMVALGWIRGSASKWKPWVANRVSTIQSLTNPASWKHVTGADSPADLVTRGMAAEKLALCELWWRGPETLRKDVGQETSSCPISFPCDDPEVEIERKGGDGVETALICTNTSYAYEMERWSTLNKAYRLIAWTLRFINQTPRRKGLAMCEKSLSLEEYATVRLTFVKILQRQCFSREIAALEAGRTVQQDSKLIRLSPFLDENGIIRVRGQIQLSELAYESKHPIILPRCHGTMLLIQYIHISQNHPGVDTMITVVRSDYEVIGLRQMVKRVKKKCVSCQRFDARACNEPAAPLPTVRVTKAPVFSVTGIDFAGPVYCLDAPGKKFYICFFVCGVVRAVHLELVESLKKDDFILAFRRFAALKRVPSFVYSDNGKNLVAGQKALCIHLGSKAPEWKFICPRSEMPLFLYSKEFLYFQHLPK